MTEMQLAELMAARLCHDLVGPIGAVAKGVELLGDGGPDAERIPTEYRLANPSQGRGWRVVVDQLPGAAVLEATIESLAPIDDPGGGLRGGPHE